MIVRILAIIKGGKWSLDHLALGAFVCSVEKEHFRAAFARLFGECHLSGRGRHPSEERRGVRGKAPRPSPTTVLPPAFVLCGRGSVLYRKPFLKQRYPFPHGPGCGTI